MSRPLPKPGVQYSESWASQNNGVIQQELLRLDNALTRLNTVEVGTQPLDAMLTALAALDPTPGLLVQTGADAVARRTLQAPAAGFTITNPAGTAGNPTFALADDLAAVEGLASTGIARRTGASTWTAGGTVTVAEGGTGVGTLTGYVKGNGTSAFTASATIPNTDISGLGTMATQNASAVAITGGSSRLAGYYANLSGADGGFLWNELNGPLRFGTNDILRGRFTAAGLFEAYNGLAVTGAITATGNATINGTFTAGDSFSGSHEVNGTLTQRSSAGTVATFGRVVNNGAFIGLTDASGKFGYFGLTNGLFEVQTAGSGYSTKLSVTEAGLVTAHNGLAVTGAITATTTVTAGTAVIAAISHAVTGITTLATVSSGSQTRNLNFSSASVWKITANQAFTLTASPVSGNVVRGLLYVQNNGANFDITLGTNMRQDSEGANPQTCLTGETTIFEVINGGSECSVKRIFVGNNAVFP